MNIWLNGQFQPADEARIAVNDRGYTLGDGLFETLRVGGGRARLFERHWQRLVEGAATLGIPVQRAAIDIRMAIEALADGADGAARVTLSRGPAPRGLRPAANQSPTWLVTVSPLALSDPVDLVVASVTRRNEHSPLSRIKSLNYLDSILALQEAIGRGAGDALMLNTNGYVAEATAANVFLLLDRQWVTPPLVDGPLPGIARAILLEAGMAVEMRLPASRLTQIGAGFLSNSLGLRAIRSVNGRRLDDVSAVLDLGRSAIQMAAG